MVRIGTAQPRTRPIDYRIEAPAEALAQVEHSLDELAQLVRRAGEAGCDALADRGRPITATVASSWRT